MMMKSSAKGVRISSEEKNNILDDTVYMILWQDAKNGKPCPSDKEIVQRLKMSSVSSVQRTMIRLEERGLIERLSSGSGTRSIRLVKHGLILHSRFSVKEKIKPVRKKKSIDPEMLKICHKLRDPRTVAYNMSVTGGDVGQWFVNGKTLSDRELLEAYSAREKENYGPRPDVR